MIDYLARLGGLMFLLTLTHFVADWLPQPEAMAVVKHQRPGMRALHCAIYLAFFMPIILTFFPRGDWRGVAIGGILWGSHFILDSYIPVALWVKYVRRPKIWEINVRDQVASKHYLSIEEWIKTPAGFVIFVTVDQIFHILCLLPVAFLMMKGGIK